MEDQSLPIECTKEHQDFWLVNDGGSGSRGERILCENRDLLTLLWETRYEAVCAEHEKIKEDAREDTRQRASVLLSSAQCGADAHMSATETSSGNWLARTSTWGEAFRAANQNQPQRQVQSSRPVKQIEGAQTGATLKPIQPIAKPTHKPSLRFGPLPDYIRID